MTRGEAWLLAYVRYVWMPFCEWLMRNPAIVPLLLLVCLLAFLPFLTACE